MSKLSLHTAMGCLRILSRGGPALQTDTLGITPEDCALVTGSEPWLSSDRRIVRRVMDSYIYGVIDALGLPRMSLPAEYAASVISVLIDPINYFPACSWLTGFVSNEELIAGKKGVPVEGFENVTPSELFSIVIQLEGKGDEAAAQYAAKTGAVITRLKQNSELVDTTEGY